MDKPSLYKSLSSLFRKVLYLCLIYSSVSYAVESLNDSMITSDWITGYESQNNNNISNLSTVTTDSDIHLTTESDPFSTTFKTLIKLNKVRRTRMNHTDCRLSAVDPFTHSTVKKYVEGKANLIEYRLSLKYDNQSENRILEGMPSSHKPNHWSRVATQHGQTLLTLAFNYGVLSLMTLKLGTEILHVDLQDHPYGCFVNKDEKMKVEMILDLLMRDFSESEDYSLSGKEAICHEMIENNKGFAKFKVYCCGLDERSAEGDLKCEQCKPNGWLSFLYFLLFTIRVCIVLFGPLLFLSGMSGLTRDEFPYTVKLRDPLIKTVFLSKPDFPAPDDLVPARVLNLTDKRGFPKLRESVYNAPSVGTPFQIKISQYDINVNYRRLLTENRVPVGFWKSISRAIFYCKLRNVDPFQQCCRTNMFRLCPSVSEPVPWINFWRKVGLALLVLVLPTPYYLRLFILYQFEYDEIVLRKQAAHRLHLHESFEYSLVHYLLPDHPIFISIYIIYFLTVLILGCISRRDDDGRTRKVIVGAFTDLKNLSWIRVLRLAISNVIWPFRRYGLVGIPVALIYWPIAIPITVIVYLVYCLPTIYITFRMFFYSRRAFLERVKKTESGGRRSYRVRKHVDDTMRYFDVEYIMGDEDEINKENTDEKEENTEINHRRILMSQKSRVSDTIELDEIDNLNPSRLSKYRKPSQASVYTKDRAFKVRRHIFHVLAASLCVLSLYSILIILSECVGCFVEILVFTTMGIIVNANQLLKYIALVVLLVAYSYDSFNNVEKRYLKLNKALFSEVKSRIKDLDKVTSLPSYLQENFGFKSQELTEQADYEMSDDITVKPSKHWMINDLVLFIDNEDMPRIPKKLFEDVCQIKVAGVPGPVYMGLLYALKQFLKIIIFVLFIFVVILSFGSIYEVSSTNQMLAALAGGSLPMIMRTFMEPEKPDIEMGTVSFKSKLDEIIKNFAQLWPIYDFPFEEYIPEPPESAEEANGSKDKELNKNSKNNNAKHEYNNINEEEDQRFNQRTFVTDEVDGTEVSDSYTQYQTTSSPDTKRLSLPKSKPSAHKVCFKENSFEEEPVTKVDLLIKLPVQYDDVWLDEWSDIGDITGASGPTIQKKQQRVDSLDSVFIGRA